MNRDHSFFGAILGDLAGSKFEFNKNLDPNVDLWTDSFITDDTVLTVATMEALMSGVPFGTVYRRFYMRHPDVGYGPRFIEWCESGGLTEPSMGNGAPMRVSPVAYVAESEQETLALAKLSAECSHGHPDGIRAAQLAAAMVYRALRGRPKWLCLNRPRDSIQFVGEVVRLRKNPEYNILAMPTLGQAVACVKDADSFEGTLRNAVSVGGDADTIGAIAGAIAGAMYGVPPDLVKLVQRILPKDLLSVVKRFETYAKGKKHATG